VQTAS
jgi:hypothetical protein